MQEIRFADAVSRNWVRRTALVAVLASFVPANPATAKDVVRDDLATVFQEQGVDGAFVLYDAAKDITTFVNRTRAEKRFVPASTFKIANSLIALETQAVRDENEVVPYGGQPQPFKSWEKDMSMREAIAASNVPVYQEIARRVGPERYRDWLARLAFGNGQVGDRVTTFWLDGPLEISAVEQARFLSALARGELRASKRAMGIVRDIAKLETTGDATLYGKTGLRFSSNPLIGWWVGWIERKGEMIAFALNIDLTSADDAPKRDQIGKALLQKLGAW